jgi:WD40 repeat protein
MTLVPGLVLSPASYEQAGELKGAIDEEAEGVCGRFPAAQAAIRKLFQRITERGAGERPVRNPATMPVLAEITGLSTERLEEVVSAFEERRLLIRRRLESGEIEVDLPHECVAWKWGRLAGWIAEEAAAAKTLQFLRESAEKRQWLTGSVLDEALTFRNEGRLKGAWPRRYLSEEGVEEVRRWTDESEQKGRSERLRLVRERAEKEERRQSELRRARRLLAIVSGAAVIFLLLGLLAWALYEKAVAARKEAEAAKEAEQLAKTSAVLDKNTAEKAKKAASDAGQTATSRALAAAALSQIQIDPMLSVLLAVEGTKTAPTAEAISALRRALNESRERAVLDHQSPIDIARYNLDGTRAFTLGSGEVRVWDVSKPATSRLVAQLKLPGVVWESAAFSHDGKYIVTAGGNKEGPQQSSTVQIWSAEAGKPFALPPLILRGSVHAAELSPDGKLVITATSNCTAALWDWSGDRTAVVLQDDACRQTATLENPGCRLKRNSSDREAFAAAFSSNGRLVATGSGDCTIRVWDVATRQLRRTLPGHSDTVNHVVFSPDDKFLLSTATLPGGFDVAARLWNVETWTRQMLSGQDRPYGATFSPNSQYVATGDGSGMAWAWDVKTGNLIAELRGHTNWVWSAAFSPRDSRLLVTSGQNDGTARVWDIGESNAPVCSVLRAACTGQELFVLRGHEGAVVDAVFNPQGDQILTASSDGTARIWSVDLGTTEPQPPPGWPRGGGGDVSPDRKLTLALNDTEVRVHDNVTGRDLKPLRGHAQRVQSARFSHAGNQIVTAGGDDNTAHVWDTSTSEDLVTLRGHSGSVKSAEFDQTDTFVVTTSADGTARVWDVATGESVAELWTGREVVGASFKSDNKSIVTWPGAGSGKRYPCRMCGSVGELLVLAREQTRNRSLGAQERRRFLHE